MICEHGPCIELTRAFVRRLNQREEGDLPVACEYCVAENVIRNQSETETNEQSDYCASFKGLLY